MKWFVYYHSWNSNKITTFNIFDHYRFTADVEKALSRCRTKDEFAKQLKRDLFYYFGSKCEWEVVIKPWVGDKNNEGIKVDVYEQVMLNWDVFLDYVWIH